jgi:hypothetical protein
MKLNGWLPAQDRVVDVMEYLVRFMLLPRRVDYLTERYTERATAAPRFAEEM